MTMFTLKELITNIGVPALFALLLLYYMNRWINKLNDGFTKLSNKIQILIDTIRYSNMHPPKD